MEEKKLVSIIVPIYNMEIYLERCLNSLIWQTYKTIEIILVDDGSTDNSGNICDLYARRDARVKVAHIDNGGQARARNVGIEMAKGSYISFVDSDDWVSLDSIAIMVSIIETYDVDVAVSSFEEKTAFDSYKYAKFTKVEICSAQRAMEDYFYQKIGSSPWAKLYRKTLFEDIRYPEGEIYEDVEPSFYLIEKAKSVAETNAVTYFYFDRNNSTVKSNFSEKKMNYYYATHNLLELVRGKYPKLEMAAISRMIWADVHLIVHMGDERSKYQEEFRLLWNDIKKYRGSVITKSKARRVNKAVMVLSYGGARVLCLIYNRVSARRG